MIPGWQLAVLGLAMAFTPSNEWQVVPEGVAIPKGLDVRMDMATGERFARLAEGRAGDDAGAGVAAVAQAAKPAAAALGRPILDLEQLEELAHDVDHGQELMEQYGPHLVETFESTETTQDSAGRVLGIAVRNNPGAASALLSHDPGLPGRLATRLGARDVYILANLATAQYAAVQPALETAQDQLRNGDLSVPASKQIVRLVKDVSHLDADAVAGWAGAIQQALVTSRDRRGAEVDGARLELLRGLTTIVERKDEFAGISRPDVTADFVAWLADQAVRSGPSGVVGRSDNGDNTSGQFLQYVKQVRHRVYGNPKAARLHMDL